MARTFNGVATNALQYGGAIVGASGSEDCTFSAWVKPSSVSVLQFALSTAFSGDGPFLGVGFTASGVGTAWSSNLSANSANSANAATIGVWTHLCGVFTKNGAGVDITAVLGGDWANRGTKSAATWSLSTSVDRVSIGANRDSTVGQGWNGSIANAAIWTSTLGQSDVEALARGISPLHVRPSTLAAYWPLHGVSAGAGEAEVIARQDMALVGSVGIAESYPVFRGDSIVVSRNAAAAPSGFQSAWAARSTVTIQPGMVA